MSDPRVLVTGVAGFIGYHLAERLLADGVPVVGVDNVNDYYDRRLKRARLARLARHGERFDLREQDLADAAATAALFAEIAPRRVVHLAAQAGVRYSLTNPHAYVEANVTGFLTVLEGCRHHGVEHLVYASSSSVYGANTVQPFAEAHRVDRPVSLYAATKRCNELMAHTYAHLFGVRSTGLRFFTVYGPWGRPDMALYLFTEAILAGRPIQVFNHGDMERDFTYVDDVVEGVVRLLPDTGGERCRLFNVGNNAPVALMDMIRILEAELGVRAELRLVDMQPGDVRATWADASALMDAVGYQPSTPLEVGIPRFVRWYREYHAGR